MFLALLRGIIKLHSVDCQQERIIPYLICTGEGMSWTEFTELDCMKLEIGHQVRGFRGKLNHLQIFDLSLSAR